MLGPSELIPSLPDDQVRSVGRLLVDVCLGEGRSLLDSSSMAWGPASVAELAKLYRPESSFRGNAFLYSLPDWAAPASDDARLLIAELLTLHALPLGNLSAQNKAARVEGTLRALGVDASIPHTVLTAFQQHSWRGGRSTHTTLYSWFRDAIDFLERWWTLSTEHRQEALRQPQTWQQVVLDGARVGSLRGTLLYLAFPTHFLPVASVDHKVAIRDAYAHLLEAAPAGDVDGDLRVIVLSLQALFNGPVHLYQRPLRDDWLPPFRKSGQKKIWMFQSGRGGVIRTESGLLAPVRGTMGHLLEVFGGVPAGATRPDIAHAVERYMPARDVANYETHAAEVNAAYGLFTAMKPET